jgi:spoIIIJ-associated protein
MDWVETKGKTFEEAVNQALAELNCSKEEVDIEILEESSKGFFGIIGGKEAKVRVVKKAKVSEPLELTVQFLKETIQLMGVEAEVEIIEAEETITLTMVGKSLGTVIGWRGETLDALQYLTGLMSNRYYETHDHKRIILDAEGYRLRREKTLIKLALKLCEKVKRTGHRVVLEPMNPQERRIIHTALQNESAIQTLSEGEDPFRKVIISPKRSSGKNRERSAANRQ